MKKTLMLWQCEVLSGDSLQPRFLLLDGDYQHLNNVYINAYCDNNEKEKQKLQDELNTLIYHPPGSPLEGRYQVQFISEPPKEGWDFFIHAGFLP